MKFFKTPLQERILKSYWERKELFTIDSLYEQKVVRNRLWGSFSMKTMLRKRQIIQKADAGGNETSYIGTTDSQEEWDALVQEKRLAGFPFTIVEDCGLSGLNKYEKAAALSEMMKLIDEKAPLRGKIGKE